MRQGWSNLLKHGLMSMTPTGGQRRNWWEWSVVIKFTCTSQMAWVLRLTYSLCPIWSDLYHECPFSGVDSKWQKKKKNPTEFISNMVSVIWHYHVNGSFNTICFGAMLSLSGFHPTSLLLSRVGKVYAWFTHLLGDSGKEWGGLWDFYAAHSILGGF